MHQPLLTDAPADAPATGAATTAARRAGVVVRELDTPAATAAAAELFTTIWRAPSAAAPVSADLMRALSTTGNYVSGAYAGDTLVGAAVAFYTDEQPRALHSHICGVAGAMQGRSVGFALKLHQRAWALDRDIATIGWTVDPLVRRNVYFNLAKLGAAVDAYLPDFYGPMQDGVNAEDASDRLLLGWPLRADPVAAACDGIARLVSPGTATPPLLAVGRDDEPVAGPAAGTALLCEVPADIVGIRAADPALARAWRQALREAIGTAMDAGYRVTGVTRAGAYVLTRQPEPPAS